MHGACHAEWSVPDARRSKHRAPHHQWIGAFDASQLEARRVLCRGEDRSAILQATTTHVQEPLLKRQPAAVEIAGGRTAEEALADAPTATSSATVPGVFGLADRQQIYLFETAREQNSFQSSRDSLDGITNLWFSGQ